MRRSLVLHTRPDSGAVVEGVNGKDHRVLAVALEARAHVVVTNDRPLRREIGALQGTVAGSSADDFAHGLCNGTPRGSLKCSQRSWRNACGDR